MKPNTKKGKKKKKEVKFVFIHRSHFVLNMQLTWQKEKNEKPQESE